MKPKSVIAANIDDYIARFPPDIQARLEKLRRVIQKAAPTATEKITYQIPTIFLQGNLVHFAAFKHHIGFYPTASGTHPFEKELSDYECSKGTVRFPLDQPIPFDLVARIVRFRAVENTKKASPRKQSIPRNPP